MFCIPTLKNKEKPKILEFSAFLGKVLTKNPGMAPRRESGVNLGEFVALLAEAMEYQGAELPQAEEPQNTGKMGMF